MFEDLPYQLSADCLGLPSTNAGEATKEENDKQVLQYNPPIDFTELLDAALQDGALGEGRNFTSKCSRAR